MSAPEATSESLQKGDLISPFRQGAPDWIQHNIAVFPMDPVQKKPLVYRPDRFTVDAARRVLEREQRKPRPNINLAFAPGPRAGVTVIDVDSPNLQWFDRAIKRYGETPLMWRTPSGGVHLAYRYSGEKRRVRVIVDEPIDRLAGGICAAPPSRRETGSYHFIAGNLDDWTRLPKIREEMSKEPGQPAPSSFRPVDGTRNDRLFKAMLRVALRVDTRDEFVHRRLIRLHLRLRGQHLVARRLRAIRHRDGGRSLAGRGGEPVGACNGR